MNVLNFVSVCTYIRLIRYKAGKILNISGWKSEGILKAIWFCEFPSANTGMNEPK